jgi:hypothetical protein
MKNIAAKDWELLFELNKLEDSIFTHQLAEMLESGFACFYTFQHHREKLEQVAEFIAFGNSQLEENISDSIRVQCYERSLSIVTKQIMDA